MILEYTLSVPGTTLVLWAQPIGPETGAATEKEVLINFHKFLLPETVFVQNATS